MEVAVHARSKQTFELLQFRLQRTAEVTATVRRQFSSAMTVLAVRVSHREFSHEEAATFINFTMHPALFQSGCESSYFVMADTCGGFELF